MNLIAKLVSLVGLIATIAPSVLAFAGMIGVNQVPVPTLIGTVVWFIATPIWMGREVPLDAKEVEI